MSLGSTTCSRASHPVEGGCSNDYAYVFGDPVNASDLDGRKCKWSYVSTGDVEWGTFGGGTYLGLPGAGGSLSSRYGTQQWTRVRAELAMVYPYGPLRRAETI